jgi:hypothetical protein
MGIAAGVLQAVALSVCCGLLCRWKGHYTAAIVHKPQEQDSDYDEEASLKS